VSEVSEVSEMSEVKESTLNFFKTSKLMSKDHNVLCKIDSAQLSNSPVRNYKVAETLERCHKWKRLKVEANKCKLMGCRKKNAQRMMIVIVWGTVCQQQQHNAQNDKRLKKKCVLPVNKQRKLVGSGSNGETMKTKKPERGLRWMLVCVLCNCVTGESKKIGVADFESEQQKKTIADLPDCIYRCRSYLQIYRFYLHFFAIKRHNTRYNTYVHPQYICEMASLVGIL
jgi:hypothetical protein